MAGYRAKLAQTGYTFEYSATFGQAIFAAKDEALTQEYGKAILFDYSYKYFYGDGFGKDFEVLNLAREDRRSTDESAFAWQSAHVLRAEAGFPSEISRNAAAITSPIRSGYSSAARSTPTSKPKARFLTVVQFFDALLRNERGWVQKKLKQILDGASGIEDDGGHDVFAGRFKQLKPKARTRTRSTAIF